MSNTTNTSIGNKQYDIYKRIYNFILGVLRLANKLPLTTANKVIIPQIIRSSTSMGANGQEADGTLTRKDFTHCFTLIRKEGKETIFWLNLTSDINLKFKMESQDLIREGNEIIAIISSIINKTRSK